MVLTALLHHGSHSTSGQDNALYLLFRTCMYVYIYFMVMAYHIVFGGLLNVCKPTYSFKNPIHISSEQLLQQKAAHTCIYHVIFNIDCLISIYSIIRHLIYCLVTTII